ncbi:MAG TPA: 1-deoxy-D-xylulose-5-phosphate reductoisomerase, partial [Jatrophihabitans sp.]|nr:1-deoxy-D-xylulose-5-phosphate reductoisomerase [Jatrophihabitans sp.]
MSPRRIAVLGSTGSIGTQALEVIAQAPDRFRATVLAAGGGNLELLAEQAARHRVAHVAISDPARAGELRHLLAQRWPAGQPAPQLLAGPAATAE